MNTTRRGPPPVITSISRSDDNLFHGDRFKWSGKLEVINLTNADVPYKLVSTCSGTHYVTPGASPARSDSTSDPRGTGLQPSPPRSLSFPRT